MKHHPLPVAVLFALMTFHATQAQEQPPAEQAGAEAQEAAVDEEDESQESDENFIPSEKINVDSSVSFPVDI